jgi:glycosyltransferase involved in cell wall biosynthesis
VLEAWRQLNGINLKICGDGPLSPAVEAEAARNSSVEWLGHVDQKRVGALLARARFLVVPSECYEGMPLVILEAFARGTPVIASELGAMPTLVSEGKTGMTFKPGSASSLAARVRELCSDPRVTGSMRQAARREFESKYNATANYHRILEIYRTALQLSSRPGQVCPSKLPERRIPNC